MCRTGRLDDKKRCLCNDLHACVYAITFLQAFFSSSIYARDKFYVNFYVNYVWSTHFLSFHSGLVLLFLWKKTVIDCPKQSDADSIYPGTHFWLVAAAGMYSCPVATMFCEKLLTRRDTAENLKNQEKFYLDSIVILCCWNKDENVIMFRCKVIFHEIVQSIQRGTPCKHTVWREFVHKIAFTSFESCCSKEKFTVFGWQFIWHISSDFQKFSFWNETHNFRMPELSFLFQGASSGSYGIGPCKRPNNFRKKHLKRNLKFFLPGQVCLKSPQSQSPCE